VSLLPGAHEADRAPLSHKVRDLDQLPAEVLTATSAGSLLSGLAFPLS